MKRINAFRHISMTSLLSCVLLFTVSCKEDENEPTPDQNITNEANAYVNSWIQEQMELYYLWNTELPSNTDLNLNPDVYFEELLSDDDRFSWIQDNYQELLNSLQGINKEAGYEFVLYKESESSNNVIAQILYVKPTSPAEAAGLNRGDVITHINEQLITTENYQTLLSAISENHTIRYKPLLIEEQAFDVEKTASLTTLEYSENPNYLSKVITAEGNRKIGYYLYNFFAEGSGSSYNNRMEEIFAEFKAQGITDLVLDLRYNSGGLESTAALLASHIGVGVNESKVFSRRQYNQLLEDAIIDEYGEEALFTKFKTKASNVGSMLSNSRVYILTGSRTASASELIINSLKPFMEVYLIGDQTYGKNMGSFSLFKDNDPKNKWGMQPIVVKLYNSLDQSEYSNGFTPDILNKDNSLYLYPLGDPREELLSEAIAHITGVPSPGRERSTVRLTNPVGHSLDKKKRSFNLTIDKNVPDMDRLLQ